MERKQRAIVLVLTALILFVTAVCVHPNARGRKRGNEERKNAALQGAKAQPEEREEERGQLFSSEEEAKGQERKKTAEISGITEETLAIMQTDKEELSKELVRWTAENGYRGVTGAVFREPVEFSPAEQRYSMPCELKMEKGTGMAKPGENTIWMDYYKEKGKAYFHR